MYVPRDTRALLTVAFLAISALDANAQLSTSQGAVIEVTVEPLRNGKPPRDVRCVERVKLVKGKASIQTFTGRRKEILEGEEVCITPSGELTTESAAIEQQNNPGGITPPCVTQCNGNSGIQIR